MNPHDIPFVKQIGIEETNQGLALEKSIEVSNHLETIHAGALFTLAETASGMYLQKLFPDLSGKVIPIVRDAQIKYKKPAQKKVYTSARVEDEAREKFSEQFAIKRRGSITVTVDLKDEDDLLIAVGEFNWFVQSI